MSKEYESRAACLDDWSELCDLVRTLRNSPAGDYISTTLEDMELALVNSISPQVPFRLQVLTDGGQEVMGYAMCVITKAMNLASNAGPDLTLQCGVHSFFLLPEVTWNGGIVLRDGIESYAREQGCNFVYGNVRHGGPLNLWSRKYGYEPMWTAIGKELK